MIVYVCKKCKHGISWGSIICPGCGTHDPKIEALASTKPSFENLRSCHFRGVSPLDMDREGLLEYIDFLGTEATDAFQRGKSSGEHEAKGELAKTDLSNPTLGDDLICNECGVPTENKRQLAMHKDMRHKSNPTEPDWEGAESVEVFKSPDSLVNAPSPKEELELEELLNKIREFDKRELVENGTYEFEMDEEEAKQAIQKLIHQAAITELERLIPQSWEAHINEDYLRKRIKELKEII